MDRPPAPPRPCTQQAEGSPQAGGSSQPPFHARRCDQRWLARALQFGYEKETGNQPVFPAAPVCGGLTSADDARARSSCQCCVCSPGHVSPDGRLSHSQPTAKSGQRHPFVSFELDPRKAFSSFFFFFLGNQRQSQPKRPSRQGLVRVSIISK